MALFKIKNVCTLHKGKTGIMKATPGKYPLITTGDKTKLHNEYQLDAKAVCVPLVSSTGHGHASMKRVYYQEGKFAVGSILTALVPKDEKVLNAKYLYTYLSHFKDRLFVPLMKGTANVSLSMTKISNVEIPVPPFKRQLEIVNKATVLTNKKNDLLHNLFSQFVHTSQLRQAILQEAVQGKLVSQDPNDEPASELLNRIKAEKEQLIADKIIRKEKPLQVITDDEILYKLPNGWEWCRFLDAVINRDGERIPLSREDRQHRQGEYDYYGASGVIDKIDDFIFDKELLLIGEDGANLINRSTPIAFKAKGKYWVNNHAHVIDAIYPIILDYYKIFVNSIDLKPYVTGTAQPKMNQSKMNNILVSLPPLAEQKRIVAKVDELMSLCDRLEEQINESKDNADMLMQAVLKEAFEA